MGGPCPVALDVLRCGQPDERRGVSERWAGSPPWQRGPLPNREQRKMSWPGWVQPRLHLSVAPSQTPKLSGLNSSNHLLGSQISHLGKAHAGGASRSRTASDMEILLAAGGPASHIWLPGWCWPSLGAQEGHKLCILPPWVSPCGLGLLAAWGTGS